MLLFNAIVHVIAVWSSFIAVGSAALFVIYLQVSEWANDEINPEDGFAKVVGIFGVSVSLIGSLATVLETIKF